MWPMNSAHVCFVEGAFRSQLIAQEQELMELRDSNCKLAHELKSKERIHKEVAKLKTIISSQDDTVSANWGHS